MPYIANRNGKPDVDDLLLKDVRDVTEIRRLDALRRVADFLAARTGKFFGGRTRHGVRAVAPGRAELSRSPRNALSLPLHRYRPAHRPIDGPFRGRPLRRPDGILFRHVKSGKWVVRPTGGQIEGGTREGCGGKESTRMARMPLRGLEGLGGGKESTLKSMKTASRTRKAAGARAGEGGGWGMRLAGLGLFP